MWEGFGIVPTLPTMSTPTRFIHVWIFVWTWAIGPTRCCRWHHPCLTGQWYSWIQVLIWFLGRTYLHLCTAEEVLRGDFLKMLHMLKADSLQALFPNLFRAGRGSVKPLTVIGTSASRVYIARSCGSEEAWVHVLIQNCQPELWLQATSPLFFFLLKNESLSGMVYWEK